MYTKISYMWDNNTAGQNWSSWMASHTKCMRLKTHSHTDTGHVQRKNFRGKKKKVRNNGFYFFDQKKRLLYLVWETLTPLVTYSTLLVLHLHILSHTHFLFLCSVWLTHLPTLSLQDSFYFFANDQIIARDMSLIS